MGFWLGCVAVAGLIVQSLSEKISRQSNQIKSKQLSLPIRRQKRNSSTQNSFQSFIDTKIGYHLSDYKKRTNLLTPRFLCYTTLAATKANKKRRKRTYDSLMKVSWLAIELCLITCLYVTKHHLFTQNSNLISRSINITRSLHVKRPTLNIITWLPGPTIKSPPTPTFWSTIWPWVDHVYSTW